MKRLPDWQLRLEAFARERRAMPFAWGSNDCALFAAGAVQAETGELVLPYMRGYSSAREALVLIEQAGGLRGIACHALGGFVAPALARIGDVVLVTVGKREALAVCNGGTVIAPAAHGLAALPMRQAVCAWRVG